MAALPRARRPSRTGRIRAAAGLTGGPGIADANAQSLTLMVTLMVMRPAERRRRGNLLVLAAADRAHWPAGAAA